MAEREEQDQNRFQNAGSCDSGDSVEGGDVGKSTGKTEKAMVRDGHCRWESPGKTGKVNQRIYHLTVSTTGSTESGLVGETSIDFADYVDAIKTCNVSLPLQSSNSKAILHEGSFGKASRIAELRRRASIESDSTLSSSDSVSEMEEVGSRGDLNQQSQQTMMHNHSVTIMYMKSLTYQNPSGQEVLIKESALMTP